MNKSIVSVAYVRYKGKGNPRLGNIEQQLFGIEHNDGMVGSADDFGRLLTQLVPTRGREKLVTRSVSVIGVEAIPADLPTFLAKPAMTFVRI